MKKKILLIDDDPLVLKTVSNLLQSKGYEVYGCKSSSEAIETFRSQKFDLIITDVRMPGKDGIRTIKEIRGQEKVLGYPPAPIVVITGYASEDVPLEAIELGVEGYVLKPLDYERFLAAIKKALEKTVHSSTGDSGIEQICSEMKNLISTFHDENEQEVFQNKPLRKLLSELEECIVRMEKELVKLN